MSDFLEQLVASTPLQLVTLIISAILLDLIIRQLVRRAVKRAVKKAEARREEVGSEHKQLDRCLPQLLR